MAMEMAMATLIGTFFWGNKIVRNRVEKNRLSFADFGESVANSNL